MSRLASRQTEQDWPQFPSELERYEDYERLTACVLDQIILADAAHVFAMRRLREENDAAAEREGMVRGAKRSLQIAQRRMLLFWMAHRREIAENERRLTFGEVPLDWKCADVNIFHAYFLCVVSEAEMQCCVPAECLRGLAKIMEATAMDFPAIADQCLAQRQIPIMRYDAKDLLWALDQLQRCWYMIRADDDGMRDYIRLLSLRFGQFLRCGWSEEAYGGDPQLHKECVADSATGKPVCVPSTRFKKLVCARLMDIIQRTYLSGLHARIGIADAIRIADENAALGATDSRSLPPDWTAVRGALELAKLLARYQVESATQEQQRELFQKKLVECQVCPGDMEALLVDNKYVTVTPANMFKIMRGELFLRELQRKARMVGPEPFIASQISRIGERISRPRNPDPCERQIQTFEEEIAQMCAFEVLCKNRHGFQWMDEFLVLGSNYFDRAEEGGMWRDRGIHRPPMVAMLNNTFDLLIDGKSVKTGCFLETLAVWLCVARKMFGDRIPELARPRQHKGEQDFRDLTKLRDAVAFGQESYVIKQDGRERPTLAIATVC